MAMALSFLQNKLVERIILTRPAVEAGEKLGFLPGDIAQKVNPYLRPLYDALFDLSQYEQANRLMDKGVIEIAPLAFMRGRTLNNAFIILDEAQNTTREQMKMILTRQGFDSRLVVTADITQIDLPEPEEVRGPPCHEDPRPAEGDRVHPVQRAGRRPPSARPEDHPGLPEGRDPAGVRAHGRHIL